MSKLVKVLKPGEFEKETYFLTDDEKFNLIPKLRESGNALYNASDYEKACEKYGQVLQFFDELMIKEKPNDVEWKKLDEQRRPILLNFVQCKLKLGEYYSAIEHATTILNSDSTNSKALYRRAKAHVGAWNIKEAKEDFETLLKVDPSLNALVKQELNLLAQAEQEKNKQDKSNLTRLFST
ncbi:unnamed protein product [Didymodactylos carnosus]|uniref:AH receptor-interacting protein n=1 Tax=Didymodactylos carnosus TaxID=1234261 RepID=A0A813NJ51_9BILA|nr:unnamed protein product [Didymodactylos carnosus]CAF0915441.1 unnamed protein product [Didymodactylos carnosus]CAF3517053.1 unnamed protein product [Didymodactylos carnosus]CAF3693784.1 unnamed protein product [Didymodactylos carnosus]